MEYKTNKNTRIYTISFILEERLYIQVAYSTEQEETLKRELRPLELIKDNYPKLLLTMDTVLPEQNFEGIQKTNALNWLAN